MQLNIVTNDTLPFKKKAQGIVEIVFVFIFTYLVCGVGLATILGHFIHLNIQMSRGWESHIPMILISFIWFRIRVAPILPEKDTVIWKWRKGSGRFLRNICIWYVPAVFLLNLSALHTTFENEFGTLSSAVSTILFQCVFVGLSEEMMIRPALQLPLSRAMPGGFHLGKITISHSIIITALLFGGMHMVNLIYQPFLVTIFQSIYAFVLGILIGFYYERTQNYLGAAVLHGINDGISPILVLLASLIHVS